MPHNLYDTLQEMRLASGATGKLYSLPALEKAGIGRISRLPVSIRIVLESVLRNCDGKLVTENHVAKLAAWSAKQPGNEDVPFRPARVILQDFTGVPAVVDLAAMRSAMKRRAGDPLRINPMVPVDLVIDHSVQVDVFGTPFAIIRNAAPAQRIGFLLDDNHRLCQMFVNGVLVRPRQALSGDLIEEVEAMLDVNCGSFARPVSVGS